MCFQVTVKYFAFSLELLVKTAKSYKANNLRTISSEPNSYRSRQKLAGPEAGWSRSWCAALEFEGSPEIDLRVKALALLQWGTNLCM